MKSKNYKTWKKPELVVMTRSMAKEFVLTNCKMSGASVGAGIEDNPCHKDMCGIVCFLIPAS